jgi:hypothetical protein
MISALFAMTAGAQVGEGFKDYGEVLIDTTGGIRLDAEMEEVYLKATPYEIKYNHLGYKNAGTDTETDNAPKTEGRTAGLENGAVVPEGVATGTAYMVYDGSYLWLYVDIVDPHLTTKAPDALSSSFRQDSVEFQMDWTNEAGNNGTQILQARMTHEGYISGREDGPKGVSLFGSVDDGGPNPVTWLKGDAKHTDKGWACEFRIEVPTDFANDKFSLAILINDYDETADGNDVSSRVMVCADDINASGQWYGHKYGYIKFDYLNYQPDTGDNTIVYIAVAMVMALGLAAGTVVSMKKRAAK